MEILKETKEGRQIFYLCLCPYCKNTKKIRKDHFKTRKTEDCGCLKHNDAKNGKHSKLYDIHQAMKQRCLNPNQKYYYRYGGRGIKICEDWLDYKIFKKWALDNGYEEGLDLDRIDNNGNYCPENCRFVSHIVNCNNRRNAIYHIINGERLTTRDIANKYNLNYSTVYNRYARGKRNEELIKSK